MYIGAMTETGITWQRENGVTGDERNCVTVPGTVSLNLEHHYVLSTAFLQGPGSLLLGGGGENPYLWTISFSDLINEVSKKPLSSPVPPRGSHSPCDIVLGTMTASLLPPGN